jgi:hypothetical protein
MTSTFCTGKTKSAGLEKAPSKPEGGVHLVGSTHPQKVICWLFSLIPLGLTPTGNSATYPLGYAA